MEKNGVKENTENKAQCSPLLFIHGVKIHLPEAGTRKSPGMRSGAPLKTTA
jgi:hypothetical protein